MTTICGEINKGLLMRQCLTCPQPIRVLALLSLGNMSKSVYIVMGANRHISSQLHSVY